MTTKTMCDFGPWNRPCGAKPVALYSITFIHPDSGKPVTWQDVPRCSRHDNSWQWKNVRPINVVRVGLELSVESKR